MPQLKAFVPNGMPQSDASNQTKVDPPSISQTVRYDVSSLKNEQEFGSSLRPDSVAGNHKHDSQPSMVGAIHPLSACFGTWR